MNKLIKKTIKSVFQSMGFELRRSSADGHVMPVELASAEKKIIDYVMDNQLTMVSYERLWGTLMACKYAIEREVEGDFVECGVWRGGNAILAAEMFKLYEVDKKVWLFDTFKGMTSPTSLDVQATNGEAAISNYLVNERGTHNEWCYASLRDVKNNFEKKDLLSENIVFIEGDVCQTLSDKDNIPSKISILRLDTDWYDSTKKELEVLYPKIAIGGCLIIDDYGHWSGSKLATDEYFKTHNNRPFLQYTDAAGRMAVKVS
jgi:O-methyltransferase